jgi:dinuclear metal center YbgI/SA1388 family protein
MPSTPVASLDSIIHCADRLLQPRSFADWDGAWNGLQVENRGRVHRLAAAVDARRSTIQAAIQARADLLVVHHGLFWGPSVPWTGPRYRLLRLLIEGDLAVYSAHLPLDEHPRLGNNARLSRALGLRRLRPFFETKGRKIGFQCNTTIPRDTLVRRLNEATGAKPLLIPAGPAVCRRIGVVTGGAGGELRQAAEEGVDTFVTGEGPHWTHALADDLGINVLYGGHYATETFGVKALTENLARHFGLPWLFIDHPTGL